MTTTDRHDWLAELERVSASAASDDGGMVAREIADAMGCCTRVALDRLRKVQSRIVVGRRTIIGLGGRACTVPTYRLKPEA